MPNPIKYSASDQTLALKKGNYWIGTGDVGKGPTTTTDYWNGITPPSGGYTVYINKSTGGPSIVCPANDSGLISLTNGLAGQTFADVASAIDWYNTQSDKMVFNRDCEGTITNGLVLYMDSGFTPSYPRKGTAWYDLSGSGYNGTLTGGAGFSTSGGGCITFDGTDDRITFGNILNYTSESFSFNFWIYLNSFTTSQSGQGPVPFYKGQNQQNGYYFQISSNGTCNFITSQSGQSQTTSTSTGAITLSTWYNICITRNGSSCKVYVDGVNKTSTSGTHVNPSSSSENFTLGSYGSSTYGNMNIAMFGSYNRELSSSEVLQNYNALSNTRFLDPDVLAWSQSSSITDLYWLSPLNTATKSLKASTLWSKIVYCNPVAGGTSLSVSIPLKHPLGSASLIFGNPSISASGISGDGVGTYINTQMNIDPYIPGIYDQHHLFYQNLTTGYNPSNGNGRSFGGYGIGQNANADGGVNAAFCLNGSEVNGFGDCPYNLNPSTRMSVNLTGGKKWIGTVGVSRTSASNAVVYINGNVEFTETDNLATRNPNLSYSMTVNGRTNLWQRPFFWMAPNNVSNANWDSGVRTQLDTRYVSSGRFAWFSNGAGLTTSELNEYNSILTTLQTAWGRNV